MATDLNPGPRGRGLVGLAALALVVGCKPPPEAESYADPHGPVIWQPGTWDVVWQDEFEGPAGSPPDATRWSHELGGWGWGNYELQYYTDRTDNAALDGDGHLVITARAETFETNAYTSARLTTKGHFAQTYGRFEARIRLANGRGLWPAFWMLGDDFDDVGWPLCGELDIVEQKGSNVVSVSSSVHGPGQARINVPVTGSVLVPGVDTDFHVYAVEWDPNNLVFLVDGVPHFQITPRAAPKYARWVYDHPFFINVNLAVGGLFPGDPDATTVFPTAITVDYVRVSVRQSDGGAPEGDGGDGLDAIEPDAGAPDGGDDGPDDSDAPDDAAD